MKGTKNIREMLESHTYPCYWHDDVQCTLGERHCQTCEHQPDDDDKPNRKNEPMLIRWETDFVGTAPLCPACGAMPYSLERCVFCGQKFIKDERAVEWSKPKEVEHMDCMFCGGKDTMEFTRSRYNGHKHGHCTACGTKFME